MAGADVLMSINVTDLHGENRRLARRRRGLAIAVSIGIAVGGVPQVSEGIRTVVGFASGAPALLTGRAGAGDREPRKLEAARNQQTAMVKPSGDQIGPTGIELAPGRNGTLAHGILATGTIILDGARIAHVSARLPATVAELHKRLGDMVAKDEVVAVLDSREMAEVRSEYLAARLTLDQQIDFRSELTQELRVAGAQALTPLRGTRPQAQMKLDEARQKLFELGMTADEVAALPEQPESNLRRREVIAPLSGRIIESKVYLGDVVGRDRRDTPLFTIANLDRVRVELALGPTELPLVREGQTVSVAVAGSTKPATGKIVFIGPMPQEETAHVMAEIANPDGRWRPGALVRCTIAIEE